MYFHLTNTVTLTTGNDLYKLIEKLGSVNRNNNIRLSEEMGNGVSEKIFSLNSNRQYNSFPPKKGIYTIVK